MISTSILQLNDFQQDFLHRFELGVIHETRVLSGGMFSQPVSLHCDTGSFVLRTHRFRSDEASFRFQAEAIHTAAEHGIPCARVLQTEDGSWSRSLPDGSGVLALHEYAEGRVYDWPAWTLEKERNQDFLVELGRRVADLHNALSQARPEGNGVLSDDLPPIQFNRIDTIHKKWQAAVAELRRSHLTAEQAAASRFLEDEKAIDRHWLRLIDSLEQHRIQSLPTQIVHGDISPVNLVFDPTGECSFIDWDCVHVGHRVYDALGDVLNRYPAEHPDLNRFRTDHLSCYLSGYSERIEIPLSQQEQALVPPFCLARQLEDLRQRMQVAMCIDSNQNEEYCELIRLRIEMMDQIILN